MLKKEAKLRKMLLFYTETRSEADRYVAHVDWVPKSGVMLAKMDHGTF
jgi:hypothetical protein